MSSHKLETNSKKTLHRLFLKRLFRNISFGIALCIISLSLGILGYHHFEHMSWIDAYVNAAMILSGMGPLGNLQTEAGKIFAGSYALFSGVIFLVIVSLLLSPILHWVLVRFHLEQSQTK